MNNLWQSFRKLGARELRLPLLALLLLALFTGYLLNSGSEAPPQNAGESTAAQTWTCSMHPQIQLPQPGACPICGMDLIPVSAGNDQDLGAREIRLSANAVRLAAIRTEPVARSYVSRTIRMSGKIAMDETRLRTISAYVPGRIERMFVDYTGTRVRKGDHLVELYSPGLISAQTELLQAARSLKEMAPDAPEALRRDAGTMLEAVREKMRLLGLTGPQIAAIEKRGAPAERLTIYSPISGIVTRRHASEGTYVQTGSPVYTVADLSHLWVMLDAYESDLEWLRYGQSVDFTVEAYPGETFTGIIAFIDPVLNATTRTVNVRVNVKNAAGRLKPEMLVRATVKSSLSSRGKVMDPALSGKWISPMHPEVVQDHPGDCPKCGIVMSAACRWSAPRTWATWPPAKIWPKRRW